MSSATPCEPPSERIVWLLIIAVSVVTTGAYIGREGAQYFWDLQSYVEALDSEFPYRAQRTYPFLYPPFAADLFRFARSHLFELALIAYVGSVAVFLTALARLGIPRRFEWLFAVTAMGGLGVVSLQSGNLAIAMNLPVLALAWRAALGDASARAMLPIAIGFGALLKPQFIVFLGLLPVAGLQLRRAVIQAAAVGAGVAAVYGSYMWFKPFEWNEYLQAVTNRAVAEKDYGWGPAGFIKHFNDSSAAAFVAFVAGLLVIAGLALATWQRSTREGGRLPPVAAVTLVFIVLTFLNPRLPLYDIYFAAIALGLCCALANGTRMPRVLAVALIINVVPWTIAEFTRNPGAWPWWMQHLQITHFLGIAALFAALARTGIRSASAPHS